MMIQLLFLDGAVSTYIVNAIAHYMTTLLPLFYHRNIYMIPR